MILIPSEDHEATASARSGLNAVAVAVAVVVGTTNGTVESTHSVLVGEHLTFGRDRTVDIRFANDSRLSRLAGTIRRLPEGVAITNLSATHDLHITSASGTVRLAATVAGQPVASLLITGGSAEIIWPGSLSSSVTVHIGHSGLSAARAATGTGRSTVHPLKLNPLTKEFAVALLLCEPRLRALPGATATPNIPDLTRQVLVRVNSFRLLAEFDTDKATRARLTARTHDHLKKLRDKLVRAKLSPEDQTLPPEAIATLLVDHNVLQAHHLGLLADPDWLTRQEQEWEQ